VADVSRTTRSARARDWLAFWSRWLALNLVGPARLDDEHDPVEQLKRRYHRPPARPRTLHATRGWVSLSHLPR
jgi:hypothetical protein